MNIYIYVCVCAYIYAYPFQRHCAHSLTGGGEASDLLKRALARGAATAAASGFEAAAGGKTLRGRGECTPPLYVFYLFKKSQQE